MTRTTLTILAVSLSAAIAHAGPKQEAKKHVDRAMKAHAAGKFDVALTELRAAYKLDPQPDLLYALGQVYSKLGHCSDATAEFEKFRAAKKKDPQITKVVDEAIAACHPASSPFQDTTAAENTERTRRSDAAKPAGEAAKPAGEPARSGGEPVVDEPKSTSTTKAASSEHVSSSATVDASASGRDVEEPSSAHVAPAAAPPPAAVAPPPAAERPPAPSMTAAAPRPWYRDVVGDALVAGGVVALVGAGIEYSSARSAIDSAGTADTLATYNSRVDDAHSKRSLSVVLGVGGAALIGAGVVRFLMHDRGGEARGVAIVPTTGGGVVTWGGSL